jgi:hypothetical protein
MNFIVNVIITSRTHFEVEDVCMIGNTTIDKSLNLIGYMMTMIPVSSL